MQPQGLCQELCWLKPALVAAAQKRAKEMGTLRNSFMGGRGNLVGLAAELGWVEYLKANNIPSRVADDYNFDVVAGLSHDKHECKAKTTTAPPKPHYDNSVSNLNVRQKADRYVFLRIRWLGSSPEAEGGILYYCGSMPCAEFKRRATFWKKGQLDRSNGYVCKNDCWSIQISACQPLETLLAGLTRLPLQKQAPQKPVVQNELQAAPKPGLQLKKSIVRKRGKRKVSEVAAPAVLDLSHVATCRAESEQPQQKGDAQIV